MDPEMLATGHSKLLLRHAGTSATETGNHRCTA
jgi:hypothetical protein